MKSFFYYFGAFVLIAILLVLVWRIMIFLLIVGGVFYLIYRGIKADEKNKTKENSSKW